MSEVSDTGVLGKVVAQFDRLVRSNGGSLALLALDGDTARIHYDPGESECETCVWSESDLAAMILEAAQPKMSNLARVEFTR